jgi:predicted RNA-binding Zn-ribbon protein involved in translation (DUF1610 family)
MARSKKRSGPQCIWTLESDQWNGDMWHTCSSPYQFVEGGPSENEFRFCPYCGRALIARSASKDHP